MVDEFGSEKQKINKCTMVPGSSICAWMIDEFGSGEQKINKCTTVSGFSMIDEFGNEEHDRR